MSVVFSRLSDEKQFVFMKGAVERIIDACTQVETADGLVPLDEEMERTVLANVEALAAQGLRVLGLAQKSWTPQGDDLNRAEVEEGMVLQGLVGLYGQSIRRPVVRWVMLADLLHLADPPRPETQGAVHRCHHAGIQVHMLTGDHAATARAIALQVGILPRNIDTLSKAATDAMVMTAAQ